MRKLPRKQPLLSKIMSMAEADVLEGCFVPLSPSTANITEVAAVFFGRTSLLPEGFSIPGSGLLGECFWRSEDLESDELVKRLLSLDQSVYVCWELLFCPGRRFGDKLEGEVVTSAN